MSSEGDFPEVLFRTRLQRPERNTPWGFRLQGGVEFSKPLTLLKVIPDSIAAKVGLNAGDILVRLAGQSAVSMTHRDAQLAIVNSGNTLEIIVERADVTCPSFSAEVHPAEVKAVNSETTAVQKQNDLQNNSGMKIEDSIERNCTPLINNTELIVVDNAPGSDVSETKTEPEVPQNRNTSTAATTTTTTAPFTPPSVIPMPPTTTNHHHPQHPPLVVSDGVTMTSSRTAQPEMENPPGDDHEGDLPDGKTATTVDDDDDLRMEEQLELEKEVEEEVEEEKLVASATGIVLPDHNDNNIPLVELELPDSFPVQALIKTNALTSEHGDDSTEGADDLSSEFSDDVSSVIEVQPEVSEATGSVDGGEDDDVIVDTDSLFYQSESEYREISLLNFDHRLLEPTTRLPEPTTRLPEPNTRLLEPTTRLPGAESSSVPETDISRMRACFYLPSIVADIEPKVVMTTEKPGGGSSSIEKLETRDFSQTAPWRLAKVIGGSRRADDTGGTASASGQHTSAFAAADRKSDHPVADNNVIYIPISIFDKQLKLGSDYSFQRISPATPGDPDPQRSPPMSLTLMGRRIEERLVVASAENNNLGVTQQRSADDVALPTPAVTMTTARVYIAPMTSQSTPVAKGDVEVVPSSAAAAAVESRRVSSEVLSELQDIPLPAVKDIVADLNSRLVKVAESYETSGGGQSAELGTSFTRPEIRRRRSSSGSDSDREAVTVEDQTPSKGLVRDHHHNHHHHLDVPDQPSTTYHSVVYRTRLSPKPSIRRFSLPGGSVTVKDSASQRRVRFAEPPESSVIEIEARRARVRDTETEAAAAAAQSASVSSLAKKLDRIELENALASAAMKRSRPFQAQAQAQAQAQVVSSLLASHPAQHPDTRTSPTAATKRGTNHRGTAGAATWKLDPIQERVINIQTIQPSNIIRGDDGRQFRIASQQRGVSPLGSVQCSADFGGIFSLSIGPGSGGHLNLSLQQHPAANHGAARSVYSPTKVNLVLPSAASAAGVGGEPGKFSYSVSTGGGGGGGGGGRVPIKYTLPPSYEESMLAMASGRHPRSSSLDDDARPVAAPAAALPSRVSELRSESHHHLVPGSFSTHQQQQPSGLRIVRARSPTLSGASHHPGWVISTSHGVQDSGPHRDPRSYCQTLQVDTGPKLPHRTQSGLPVYHARSGALSANVAGSQQQQTAKEGPQPVDPLFRIIAQPLAARGGKQGVTGDLSRPDMAARFVRGGSPLILASTGFSGPGPAQGAAGVHSFSPVSSPPGGPDLRWPPSGRIQDPHGPHPGQSVYAAAAAEAPLRTERRWPTAAAVAALPIAAALGGPIAQPPPQPASFPGEPRRQGPTATARPFPDASGGGLPPALQRMPGIFALLDKTFTDKVKQWEGSSRSGGLQQSETYKLVREMDDAMKQDKL